MISLSACGDGGSGGDGTPADPSSEGTVYKVWTAWIPDAAAAEVARAELVASNGNPGALWGPSGEGAGTATFDPVAAPGDINAILIRASSLENFSLDSVEVLDAQDRVVEHASGTVWSNLVGLASDVLGSPDGVGALTEAAGDTNAFIFTRYLGPVDRFRINARGDSKLPAPGDIEARAGFSSVLNQRPGGMAIDKNGIVHVTLTSGETVLLARFGLDGVFLDEVQLAAGVTATQGSHSVAIDKSGVVYTAATVGGGEVVVRKHQSNLADAWKVTFASGLGGDRVESNGLVVDGDGKAILAGGMNSQTGGLNHWLARVSSAGAVEFDKRPVLDSSTTTYWKGVATNGGGTHIYTTGDQASDLLKLIQAQTVRFSSSGTAQWDDQFGGEDALPDAGNAVAYASDTLIVAGFTGASGQGRDAVLIDCGTSGVPNSFTTHNGLANGDDEILDVAIDEDGSIYAAGYETTPGQGENIWVRKYDAALNPVWTRTHHGGFGNDRAISLAIRENSLAVAGYETNASGQTMLVLRVYEK